MKKIVQILLLIFFTGQLPAQNFTGQWKGEFVDKSSAFTGWGGDRCEYVLEIECNGSKVTGYSYTYFSDGGKRYYTICKLNGSLNKAGKYIELKETERTKTNVPVNIRNCFQIHRLSYTQEANEQKLEGTWVPVPDQNGDCGFGTTVLSKRILQKNPSYYNNNTTKTIPKKATPVILKPAITPEPVVKNTTRKNLQAPVVKTTTEKNTKKPVVKTISEKKKVTGPQMEDIKKTQVPVINMQPPHVITAEKKMPEARYEKRNPDLLKTIEIDNPSFTVDLYDNGDIDGDSISLFYNGRLLLSDKRLGDKALRLKLDIDADKAINELIMYAENLGTIPPNTALMVINDGDNRYEVRISSDLQKSGVIRFIHKPKK